MRNPGFETLCAHAGEEGALHEGAANPPIFQTSLFTSADVKAFRQASASEGSPFTYTRVENPTTYALERKLAALERTEAARCFGSGMAAISAAIFHCVRTGDHVICVETVYGPTRNLLSKYLDRFGIETTYVPGIDVADFEQALRPNTRLIYLESPSSMVLDLQDIRAVTELARSHGTLTILDNSWASPYFQNPAEMGVDLVVHSATKYLGGHSDIVAGVVASTTEHIHSIRDREGVLFGGILDPFAAWLMLRGIRTLPVRMERHQSSALAVARFLEANPAVACVHYPGLESYPQRNLAVHQMRGSSGLLSFELKDADRQTAEKMVDTLHYFGIGVSWGGFESLALPILFPRSKRWGARIHVGLESVEDLIEDLDYAIGQVTPSRG